MADPKPKPIPRCFLYSSDCPEGRIFKGADAIAEARENGWKDNPPKDGAKRQPAASSTADLERELEEAIQRASKAEEKARQAEDRAARAEAELASLKAKTGGNQRAARTGGQKSGATNGNKGKQQ